MTTTSTTTSAKPRGGVRGGHRPLAASGDQNPAPERRRRRRRHARHRDRGRNVALPASAATVLIRLFCEGGNMGTLSDGGCMHVAGNSTDTKHHHNHYGCAGTSVCDVRLTYLSLSPFGFLTHRPPHPSTAPPPPPARRPRLYDPTGLHTRPQHHHHHRHGDLGCMKRSSSLASPFSFSRGLAPTTRTTLAPQIH